MRRPAVLPEEAVVRPMTGPQRGFWFIQDLDPDNPSYLLTQAFDVHGPLDVTALEGALGRLVATHEALRTRFEVRDDEAVRVIQPTVPVVLQVLDLRGRADRQAAVAAELERECERPLRLDVAPLLRAVLLVVAPDEFVLTLSLHHIISDDVSLEVLWRDLGEAYTALRRGDAPPGQPNATQFSVYADWESAWLESSDCHKQVAFWQRELADAQVLRLPWAPRPDAVAWQGRTHRAWLSPGDTEAVRSFSVRHGVSPFMTLLSVFAGVVYRWTGQPDILVGVPVSLRDRPEFAEIVGALLNSLALRTRWERNPSLGEAVTAVRQTTFVAMAHAHVPFDQVVAAVPQLRAPDDNPVFQVSFSYLGGERGEQRPIQLDGATTANRWLRSRTAKFALSMDCAMDGDRLLCAAQCSDRWFDEELGVLFTDHFVRAVLFAIGNPSTPVGDWEFDDGTAVEPADPRYLAPLDAQWDLDLMEAADHEKVD
jgi:hypothetical protein